MLIYLVDEKSRQRNYSAPKRTIPEHSESSFLPEEDNNEAQPSEDEYEGDEETEVTDEEERDDQKQQDKEEDQEGQIKRDKAIKDGLGESSGHGERFRWHTVSLNGREKVLDLKLLEPYMKVISHGGTVLLTSQCSRTCIKRSPSIKQSVVKVPKIMSLNYCNFDLY